MFIDPRGKAFAHLDRLSSWQAGRKPAPVTVEWDLTNVCSLACQSCHMAHTHVAGPWAGKATRGASYGDTGRMAAVSTVERGLGEMAAAGVQAIVWSGGGEPTLHPAFASIVQCAASFGLEQGLYTLGGHVTDGLARTVGPLLSWVVVSLDAPDAETYAAEKGVSVQRFEDACAGVVRLTGECPVVGVSFLLHAGNWHRTGAMLALARGLGATYATFRPTVTVSQTQPGALVGDRAWVTAALPTLEALATEVDVEIDVRRFLQFRDWAGHGYDTCYGVRLLTQVTPDGRVWICPNRRGIAGSELGNLTDDSFPSIWAKHPGQWTDFRDCRAMCRLHLVNTTLATVYRPRQYEAFV